VATGWNIANIGAVASDMARAYGVALATVGLLTTALFLTHTLMQIPGGRASDRFGAARAGAAGLALIAAGDAIALIAPSAPLAMAGRAVMGLGTGLSFLAGSALVRESGGTAFAQGLFGGIGLGGGGLALAVVPQLDGWRAPYWSSLALAAAALVVLYAARAPRAGGPLPARGADAPPGGLLRDRRLYRLAVLYSCTYGISVVLANWVVELLQRNSTLSDGAAAVVGAFTLLLGIVTRPLGGWVLRAHPERIRLAVGASLVAGAAGTTCLLIAQPDWVAVLGGILVGVGAGTSFAAVFTGAAMTRPDAPAASIGFVNAFANLLVLVATPLVGLTFSMSGDGRIGFAVIAVLFLAATALLPDRRALGAGPA
jgi:MFS family permease